MRTSLLTLCLALASLPALHPVSQPVQELEIDRLFPVPADGLTIPERGEGGWSAERLLQEYGRLTGRHFMIGDSTRAQLHQTNVSTDRELRVDAIDVHGTVETLLIDAGFVLSIRRDAFPCLVSVDSMYSAARTNLRQHGRFVAVEDIESWRDHPAHIVHTALVLPSTDVRVLTNSMRATLTDANTQQIIPVGNSHSLILTGFGPHVADLVQMLRDVDANERKLLQADRGGEPSTGGNQ